MTFAKPSEALPDIYNVSEGTLLDHITTHDHNVMEGLMSNQSISKATVAQTPMS